MRNEDMRTSISGKGFDLMKNSEQGLYQLIDELTVNSEIFVRVLFSRNFPYAKFRDNKTSQNGKIICPLLILANHALVAKISCVKTLF